MAFLHENTTPVPASGATFVYMGLHHAGVPAQYASP